MGIRFLPKEEKFYEMFSEQAETIVEAADALVDLIKHYDGLDKRVMEMNKIEHKADEIAHRIVGKLNTSFITPLDQEDIHGLASGLDDIVDYIDATAGRLVLYKVGKPTQDFAHLANILQRAAEETRLAVKELPIFKKKPAVMRQCWIEINRLENEGDVVSRSAIAKLFETESNAVEVIKWKEIYEHIEMAIDQCEDVANILEQIVLKHA